MNGELPKRKMCAACGATMEFSSVVWVCERCDFRQGIMSDGYVMVWYYQMEKDPGPLDLWVVPDGVMLVMGELG